MGKRRSVFLCALALGLAWASTQALAAVLESPAAGVTVSGIGFISGWKCDAYDISVSLDRGIPVFVAMDLSREDTRGVCGGEDENGFLLQINWALLGDGVHTIVAYDDQIEFARSTFTVTSTGEEFIWGAEAEVVIDDFPRKGERTDNDRSKIHRLISDDRVNFVAPANYEENSQLDIIVKGILGRIAQRTNEASDHVTDE